MFFLVGMQKPNVKFHNLISNISKKKENKIDIFGSNV